MQKSSQRAQEASRWIELLAVSNDNCSEWTLRDLRSFFPLPLTLFFLLIFFVPLTSLQCNCSRKIFLWPPGVENPQTFVAGPCLSLSVSFSLALSLSLSLSLCLSLSLLPPLIHGILRVYSCASFLFVLRIFFQFLFSRKVHHTSRIEVTIYQFSTRFSVFPKLISTIFFSLSTPSFLDFSRDHKTRCAVSFYF